MFNLSETAKISCHYEPFTTAGAIYKRTELICTPNKLRVNECRTSQSTFIHIQLRYCKWKMGERKKRKAMYT